MRIVVCAQQAPLPPVDGFRLHLGYLLEELRKRHDVRLVALLLPDQAPPAESQDAPLIPVPNRWSPRWLAGHGRSLVRLIFLERPLRVDDLAARLRGALQTELDRFAPDVVHVTPGPLAALADRLTGTPSVLAALDAWHLNVEARAREARGVRRAIFNLDAGGVRRFEAALFGRYDRVVVVSEEDKQALQALDSKMRIVVIPNGVDVQAFSPSKPPDRTRGRVIFTGVMSYAPNVTAADHLARRIMPRVRESRPDAHLVLVGRNAPPPVRALSKLAWVRVVGEVPDMEPWLSGARVYACPMLTGTGIKNKLLEAMANGLPCVATRLALQGLEISDEREVLVGGSQEEFAGALVRLLGDDTLAERVGRAGREYVASRHGWETVAGAYEQTYVEAIESFTGGRRPRK